MLNILGLVGTQAEGVLARGAELSNLRWVGLTCWNVRRGLVILRVPPSFVPFSWVTISPFVDRSQRHAVSPSDG